MAYSVAEQLLTGTSEGAITAEYKEYTEKEILAGNGSVWALKFRSRSVRVPHRSGH